jgi:hypothetical protein
VAPAAIFEVPSVQPANVYPLRVRAVPAAVVKVWPIVLLLSVGRVPEPSVPRAYVTEYEIAVHWAVNSKVSAPAVYVAPEATALVPSFQPANV